MLRHNLRTKNSTRPAQAHGHLSFPYCGVMLSTVLSLGISVPILYIIVINTDQEDICFCVLLTALDKT